MQHARCPTQALQPVPPRAYAACGQRLLSKEELGARGQLGPRASGTLESHYAPTAHELFAVLRELDALGVKLIWVETPPDALQWDGVRDRLQRASA